MKLVKSSITFIVIAVLGIVLLVMAIKDKVELAKIPANIVTMTENDFYKGRFVEGTLYEMWDEFATLQESDTIFGISYNTKTTAHYFAMPLESTLDSDYPKFIAVSVRSSTDYATAKKMLNETVNYYKTGTEPTTTMYIKGKITKLTGDGAKFLDEYVSDLGCTAIHYVINVGNDGKGTTVALLIGIGVTLVGALGTVITIIRGRARGL